MVLFLFHQAYVSQCAFSPEPEISNFAQLEILRKNVVYNFFRDLVGPAFSFFLVAPTSQEIATVFRKQPVNFSGENLPAPGFYVVKKSSVVYKIKTLVFKIDLEKNHQL